jgi:hypothetical protein
MYASFEGLVFVAGTTPVVATAALFTRTEWANYNPTTIVAKFFDGKYFASYTNAAGGVSSFVFENKKDRVPLLIETNVVTTVAFSDLVSGYFYYINSGAVYQWDAAAQQYTTMDWWSKDYEFNKPVNFGAAKLEATFSTDTSAAAAAAAQVATANALLTLAQIGGDVGGEELGVLEVASDALATATVSTQAATFQLYADGVLKFSKTIYDNKVFRLPGGFKSDRQSFRVSGPLKVHALLVAETPLALERISGA